MCGRLDAEHRRGAGGGIARSPSSPAGSAIRRIPSSTGDLWSPLVLLATHRLFTRRTWVRPPRWRSSIALVLLESLYAIVALVLIAVVYVPYLLVRFRHRPPRAGAEAARGGGRGRRDGGRHLHALSAHARRLGRARGTAGLLLPIEQFRPGAFYYPGTVVLVLAAVALADRLRGAGAARAGLRSARRVVRRGAAGVVDGGVERSHSGHAARHCVAVFLAQARVPGLGAIRAVPAARTGMYLCLAVLAGYGAWVVTRARRRVGVRGHRRAAARGRRHRRRSSRGSAPEPRRESRSR
jgi:hypothetical protein